MTKRYRLPMYAASIGLPTGRKDAAPDGWFYPKNEAEELALVDAGCESDNLEDPSRLDDRVPTSLETKKLLEAVGTGIVTQQGVGKARPSIMHDRFRDIKDAAHFLRQATLGYTWAELQDCFNLGSRRKWMRAQFSRTLLKGFMQHMYEDATYGTTDLTTSSQTSNCSYAVYSRMSNLGESNSVSAILRTRLLHCLLRHFPISVPGGGLPGYGGYMLLHWYDLLNQHVFGNFYNLLEAVTYSRQMATMLTYYANEKANTAGTTQPDENYAREIMQLFTIGLWELNLDGSRKVDEAGAYVPTYDQTDIRQLARAFTGLTRPDLVDTFYAQDNQANRDAARSPWSTQAAGPVLYATPTVKLRHYLPIYEYGAKYALDGKISVPAGTDPVTNLTLVHQGLFNHPNVAPFLAKRFIRMLVTSNPTPEYVARVAAAFENNGLGVRGDMKAFWTAILCDQEATWDGDLLPTHGRMRDFFEVQIHGVRAALRVSTVGTRAFLNNTPTDNTAFGPIYHPAVPSIFGTHDIEYAEGAVQGYGYLAPEAQMWTDSLLVQVMNKMTINMIQNWEPRDTTGTSPSAMYALYTDFLPTDTAANMIDRLDLLFCGGRMSDGLRASLLAMTSGMATGTTSQQEDRITAALLCIQNSPEFYVQL